MRWADGIGEDALARMESVGAFGSQRLIGFAAWAGFGFRSFHLHQRQISDRTGPGEYRVIECGVVAGGGEPGERHQDKNEVPQGGGYQSAAGDAVLDPALFEETAGQEVLRDAGPGQNGGNAAANALVERAPSYVQLRTYSSFEANGSSRLCGLSQEIQCPAHLAQGKLHFKDRNYTPGWDGKPLRDKPAATKVKKTRGPEGLPYRTRPLQDGLPTRSG